MYFDEIGQNSLFRKLIVHFVLPDLHMPTEIQCNCFCLFLSYDDKISMFVQISSIVLEDF